MSGAVDTMGDYLRKMMGLISEAKVVADADLPFLLSLEQMIVQKLRGPVDAAQGSGQGPVPGGQDMSMGGGPPPGPPQGGPQMQGPPPSTGPQAIPIQPGGLQAGPPQPSSDELRRLLTRQ